MDLQDQLRKLFPDHQPEKEEHSNSDSGAETPLQSSPLICKYEKRKGKPVTIIEGFEGSEEALKQLASKLKKHLHVGGSTKNSAIVMQGNYRDRIMEFLQKLGYKTKRVGG